MQIKKVVVHSSGKIGVGGYQNLEQGLTLEAELEDGEDVVAAIKNLQATVRTYRGLELKDMIEHGLEDIPGYYNPEDAEAYVSRYASGDMYSYLKLIAPNVAAELVDDARIRIAEAVAERELAEAEEAKRREAEAEMAAMAAEESAEDLGEIPFSEPADDEADGFSIDDDEPEFDSDDEDDFDPDWDDEGEDEGDES